MGYNKLPKPPGFNPGIALRPVGVGQGRITLGKGNKRLGLKKADDFADIGKKNREYR